MAKMHGGDNEILKDETDMEIVGENGPEIITTEKPGTIIPADETAQILSGSSKKKPTTQTQNVDQVKTKLHMDNLKKQLSKEGEIQTMPSHMTLDEVKRKLHEEAIPVSMKVDMDNIYRIESSHNPKAYNSGSKAKGLGQITPIVLKEWNNYHPNDKHKY